MPTLNIGAIIYLKFSYFIRPKKHSIIVVASAVAAVLASLLTGNYQVRLWSVVIFKNVLTKFHKKQ